LKEKGKKESKSDSESECDQITLYAWVITMKYFVQVAYTNNLVMHTMCWDSTEEKFTNCKI
jgi:hypothetical protein